MKKIVAFFVFLVITTACTGCAGVAVNPKQEMWDVYVFAYRYQVGTTKTDARPYGPPHVTGCHVVNNVTLDEGVTKDSNAPVNGRLVKVFTSLDPDKAGVLIYFPAEGNPETLSIKDGFWTERRGEEIKIFYKGDALVSLVVKGKILCITRLWKK